MRELLITRKIKWFRKCNESLSVISVFNNLHQYNHINSKHCFIKNDAILLGTWREKSGGGVVVKS